MKTDVIRVSSTESRMEEVLEQVDKMTAYKGLGGKDALHLRLLAEEAMGMLRSIVGDTKGLFWIEDDKGTYELHLTVFADIDRETRKRLLSASSSGKNEARRGLMDRIRGFFYSGADAAVYSLASPLMLPEEGGASDASDWEWSMARYEQMLLENLDRDDGKAAQAWDELEKSVVAHVADDVRVGIRSRDVEMVIVKKII